MKLAVITDDGKTISQHFGRAVHYLVLTIENGQIAAREMRDKMGHNHFSSQHVEVEIPGQPHGTSAASHDKHAEMANTISDCQTLLCGGMGRGAYDSMLRLNIQPVVSDILDIDAAVQAYLDGKLVDRTDKLH